MRGLMLSIALLAAPLAASPDIVTLPGIAMGDVRMPITSLRQAKLAGTLLQKYDFSCGSAAVATLLTHHYGYPVNEQEVFSQMYRDGDQEKIRREGFSLLDIKRFLESRGFEADGFEQPLDKLSEARIPAIVLVNENGYHHFVVVKGLLPDRVLIGDPAQGTRVVPRDKFMAQWTNGLLFVIHNHMERAKFNIAADWRVTPRSPLASGVSHTNMTDITLPKLGPGDF